MASLNSYDNLGRAVFMQHYTGVSFAMYTSAFDAAGRMTSSGRTTAGGMPAPSGRGQQTRRQGDLETERSSRKPGLTQSRPLTEKQIVYNNTYLNTPRPALWQPDGATAILHHLRSLRAKAHQTPRHQRPHSLSPFFGGRKNDRVEFSKTQPPDPRNAGPNPKAPNDFDEFATARNRRVFYQSDVF
jgi:hypothetical protein